MRLRTLIYILLASIQSFTVLAHCPVDTIDKRLYQHALSTPTEIAQDIDKLVDYLKQPAPTKKDAARIFSYWIMQNISYDIGGLMHNVYNTKGAEGTLADKKGVCQDYSELFKAMCDRADIPCFIIVGYAKAFDYRPGSRFEKANHAWNIIMIDGVYYPMDLTWSSGYVEYKDGDWQYYIRADVSQFFAKPEEFVEKHLPADPQWQLLNHPVTMDNFLRYDSRLDMLKDSSHYYNYADSINAFLKMDKITQELKSADNAYSFYPVLGDYAYHYYNLAVGYSNAATDFYNSAVASYNKSIADGGSPKSNGDYNPTVVSNAISNYGKAINLLKRISSYADDQINAGMLLEKCTQGMNVSNELLNTLK